MALSLAELDRLPDPDKQQAPPPIPPITGGDGSKTPADLEAERQKQEKEAEQQRQQAQKTPTEIQAELEAKNIADGKNADGTTKTPEQLEADKKAEELAAVAEDNDLALWEDVDKMWGTPLEIEYKTPDGAEVHPNSPEGIFIREQAIANRAVNQFDEYLAKTDPRSYAYMLHRRAGGADEDFLARKTVTLPAYEEFKESVDLKTKVVSDSLRLKGVPENVIKLTIDDAIKNKTLDSMADKEYKDREKAEKDELTRLSNESTQRDQIYDRSVKALEKALVEEMGTGMRVIVPETKKAAFNTFVRERIQHDGNAFFFAQPIDVKSLPKILDALYFQFAGGNLQELVTRQAQTQNVNRLKRHVDQTKNQAPDRSGDGGGRKKMTLGEL